MAVITLDKLVPGESGRVKKISGKGAVRRRLVDMGFTRGVVIDMVKVSPLGDPVEYRLRGYHISLRKIEAKTIEVELIGNSIPLIGRGHFSGLILPLGRCKSGQKVIISRFRGGKRVHRRLEELGLNPGSEICVVQNDFPGPLIISLNDDRLVIGKGLAMHVFVKPAR